MKVYSYSFNQIHFNADFNKYVKVQPALKELASWDVCSFKPLCFHISSLYLEGSDCPFCTWQNPTHL